jgi:hypothetical protein
MVLSLTIAAMRRPGDSLYARQADDRTEAVRLLGWDEDQLNNPRWAVLENGYGCGYGSLVCNHPCMMDGN